MITIDEQLKVTKQLNTIACRYAQKVLLKDFLLKFTFPNCSDEEHNYNEEDIKSLDWKVLAFIKVKFFQIHLRK
jgi:hypothetical protein